MGPIVLINQAFIILVKLVMINTVCKKICQIGIIK